jgi:hypothetical protein
MDLSKRDSSPFNDFGLLGKLSRSGLFIIYNPNEKRVYINYSQNVLSFISNIMKQLKEGSWQFKTMIEDSSKLRIEVLEGGVDIETSKEHLLYWFERFSREGWEIYNSGASSPKIKRTRVVIVDLFEKVIEVRLYNRRNEFDTVGVFNSIPEAEEFVKECYNSPCNELNFRVFANNFRTRKLLSTK